MRLGQIETCQEKGGFPTEHVFILVVSLVEGNNTQTYTQEGSNLRPAPAYFLQRVRQRSCFCQVWAALSVVFRRVNHQLRERLCTRTNISVSVCQSPVAIMERGFSLGHDKPTSQNDISTVLLSCRRCIHRAPALGTTLDL